MARPERVSTKIQLRVAVLNLIQLATGKRFAELERLVAASPMEIAIDAAMEARIRETTGQELSAFTSDGLITKRRGSYYLNISALLSNEASPKKPKYQGRLTKEVLLALIDPWPRALEGDEGGTPSPLTKEAFAAVFSQVSAERNSDSYTAFQAAGYVKADGAVDTDKLWADLKKAGFVKKWGSSPNQQDILPGSVRGGMQTFKEFGHEKSNDPDHISNTMKFDEGGLYVPRTSKSVTVKQYPSPLSGL